MESKPILNQLSPYKQGKQTEEIKREYNLDRIVKLASNENPYGYSSLAKATLQRQLPDFSIYPDGYSSELRSKVSMKYGVPENQIVFGSGSEEIIQFLCRAYLTGQSNTVMAVPTFPQYKHYSMIEGAEVREVPVNDRGYHDLDGMLQAIDASTRIIWLCSPNNPTGSAISQEAFDSFMKACPSHVLVALDEAYAEFMDGERFDALPYLDTYSNLIILRTFSKAYGLAGLRIGYGFAGSEIVNSIDIVRGPFNTNSMSQIAASAAMDDQDFIRSTYEKNIAVRSRFEKFLKGIGWGYFDSEANFLLVKTPGSGMEVFQYLLENGFIVRPGELLGIPGTIRVTIGTEKDMADLQKVLTAFVSGESRVM